MYKIFLFILAFLLTACTHGSYETVEILGQNQYNATLVRGMGVRGSDGSILTSAHVVRDDSLNYMILGGKYMVVKRDTSADRAVLSRRLVSGGYTEDIWKLSSIFVGDSIYTEVMRNNKITRLTGKVQNPSASVLGYDGMGRSTTLSGIVLTDLLLTHGDSGAGIYTMNGELIDVVHVK